MPTPTPNHGYDRPDEGVTNWDDPINQNFSLLDTDVEIRDTKANLDQYDPVEGAKFFAYDTGERLLGTGTEWEKIAEPPNVIVAENAAEIQPAIDSITQMSNGPDGTIRAGIVQLLPGAYYPETTIFLKRGVTLRGVRHRPQFTSGVGQKGIDQRQTTIYTSGLETGMDAWTWRHFDSPQDARLYNNKQISKDEATHVHYPVVTWFDRLPSDIHEDRTEKELRERGHGASLQDVLLEADRLKWWDDGSKEATYFGAFDGLIAEGVNNIIIKNVETRKFAGYGAAYVDTDSVLSLGNRYQGGYTDFHGNSLTLSYSPTSPSDYVRGVWDIEANGPTPTVKLAGHLNTRFQSGAWSDATITGRDNKFLGSESDYDAGNAPLTDPQAKHAVIYHKDQHPHIRGYEITSGVRNDRQKDGVLIDDNRCIIVNTQIDDCARGIVGAGQADALLRNVQIHASDTCIDMVDWPQQVTVQEARVAGGGDGILTNNRPNERRGFADIQFNLDGAAIKAPGRNLGPLTLYRPDFRNAGSVIADPQKWRDTGLLHIHNPRGYTNEERFQSTGVGDGGTEFTIPHGLDEVPVTAGITPMTSGAAESPFYWTPGPDAITLTYNTAPPNNADLRWSVDLRGWTAPSVL